MTKAYIEKLVKLAKEIHEIQLKETEKIGTIKVETDMDVIILNSKLNYLIGYILALE